MKQKLLLSLTFCLITLTGIWAQTATAPTGSGTESDPYKIASIDNLYWLSQNSSSWAAYFEQTANIAASETSSWDSGSGFSPIGNNTTQFTGNYNGQGYTIDSLTINRSSNYYIGLFGYTKAASIDSLGLTNVDINGASYVGGLVGYNTSSTVTNSYSTGSVSGTYYCTGGLVGYNYSSSKITNSYSTGSVTGTSSVGGLVGTNYSSSTVTNSYSTGSVSGTSNVGGLVGYNSSSTISYCYSTGSVSGTSYTGGLVGTNYYSTINNSYYNSETSGQSVGIGYDSNSQTVTALTTAAMKQSTNFSDWDFTSTWDITENITFPRLQNVYDVPIILHTITLSTRVNEVYTDTIQSVVMDNQIVSLKLTTCPEGMTLTQDSIISSTPTQTGSYPIKITATDDNGYTSTYSINIEVVSFNGSGTASDPYQIASLDNLQALSELSSIWDKYFIQTANIDASETSSWDSGSGFSPIGNSTTKFTGNYNGKGYTIDSLTINRSSTDYIGLFGYTSGASIDSLGLTNVDINGSYSVGGLVGYNTSSTVTNSYSTGSVSGSGNGVGGLVGFNEYATVTNSYSTGSVSGSSSVGGLVGYNHDYSSVSSCYSTGSVSGTSYTGGLVGYNYSTATVAYSYYNSETSGQSVGIGLDSNSQTVTALTTAAMKQSTNFSDWDFETTWDITENITFPRLQNVYDVPIILHTITLSTRVNEVYTDTIRSVVMDNQIVSLKLTTCPEGMTLTQDSIISWTPTQTGSYPIEITATDDNGYTSTYSINIEVVSFNGSGTASDPYQIASLDNLQALSELSSIWDKYFIQTANIDASETSSWDSGSGFSPIGNSTTQFTGNYNGQGYTIDSLTINRSSTYYIGLFGFTSGASIDSLGLTNVDINGASYVGGLVGYNTSSTVTNSYSTGSVSGAYCVGGLVGYNTSSTVTNSYSTGSVSGSSYVGGLVGLNFSSTISYCYSTGSVSGSSSVGGLVGYNLSSTISYCYSTGSVSGSSYVGGLVGRNSSSTVSFSYYNSETSGQSDTSKGTPLTTAAMKQSTNFSSWDFTSTWGIVADSTYPALVSVNNNAPFAFADTLNIGVSSSLLTNDYDYETAQDSLTCKLISTSTKGSITNGIYSFNTGTTAGTSDTIIYCVGELLASGVTLWGNYATAVLTKVANTAPTLTAVSSPATNEDVSITLSLDDVTVTDAENDVLSLVINDGDNYTVNGNSITPAVDFYGTLYMPVYVSDGELNSDTLTMTITVTAVPTIAEISWASPVSNAYGTAIGTNAMNATASTTAGVITYSFAADSIFNAGTHTLTAIFTPTNSNDYTSDTSTVEYTVTAKQITVTADADQSKEYGDADPEFIYTVSPALIGSDDFTGSLSRDAGEDVNAYAINQGTLDAGTNYDMTFVSADFTITQAELTISADNQTISAGSEIPELTFTYEGFVNGEDQSALYTEPSASCEATSDSQAGTYAIVLSGGADTNYSFSYINGILTIEVPTAVSTVDAISISVYPNPASSVLHVEGSTGIAYLYNLAGNKVLSHNLSQSNRINIAELANGIYLLHIDNQTIKVIKQ